MGDTHYRSDIMGHGGGRGKEISAWSDVKCGTVSATVGVIVTETITTANITTCNVTTMASVNAAGGLRANAPDFSRGSFVKLGESCSIYWHPGVRWVSTIASCIASIEQTVQQNVCTPASPGPGCLFLNATKGGLGGLWVRGPTAASWGAAWNANAA